MFERPYYMDRLKRLRRNGLVKVLTGMRRAGKSGVLRLLEQALLKEGADPASCVHVDLELMENAPLRDASSLLAYVQDQIPEKGPAYVLIDEAQEAPDIARAAYALAERERVDLYLTGSHSRLVEAQLADTMAGRYVEVPVFPLSFAEYASAHGHDARSHAQLFQRYLTYGGLPHMLRLEDDPYAAREYLDGVYHTVLRRDVASTLGHEDPLVLDAIVRALMESLGSPSSASGISETLSASGRPCSDDTVARYVRALAESYAFCRVQRQDLRTGTMLKTQEKVFTSDLGLRTLLLGPAAGGLPGLLQNVVYLELRRRFGRVYLGKHYSRSICFVAEGSSGRAYFQVEPSVLDASALESSLAPLRVLRDNYPKTLLTLDEVGVGSHNGIEQRNLVDWLLEA